MKVIGTTPGGWICEITNEEMGRIRGFHSKYSDGFSDVHVGTQADLSEMYDRAREAVDSFKKASKAADELKDAANRFMAFTDGGGS